MSGREYVAATIYMNDVSHKMFMKVGFTHGGMKK